MELEHALAALLDLAADVVAVAGPTLQQGQGEQLGAALLELPVHISLRHI